MSSDEQTTLLDKPEALRAHDLEITLLLSFLRALGLEPEDASKVRHDSPDVRVYVNGEVLWFDFKDHKPEHPYSISIKCWQVHHFEEHYPKMRYVWANNERTRFYSATPEQLLAMNPKKYPQRNKKGEDDPYYTFPVKAHMNRIDNDGKLVL